MTLTAVHHTASTLNYLICKGKWTKAYEAADALDLVIATEDGQTIIPIHTYCNLVHLAEERLKRTRLK